MRVGAVDNTRKISGPSWYRQYVEVLRTTHNQFNEHRSIDAGMLSGPCFALGRMSPALFEGFNDNCVLIHGNFCLRSMLIDSRSDQLLAMVGPGLMLWAPREYELFRTNG